MRSQCAAQFVATGAQTSGPWMSVNFITGYERLAAVVGRVQAVSVDHQVGAGVDPLRLAEALAQAAQVRRRACGEVRRARRPHVQLTARRAGIERSIRRAKERGELSGDAEERLEALPAVCGDGDLVADAGDQADVDDFLSTGSIARIRGCVPGSTGIGFGVQSTPEFVLFQSVAPAARAAARIHDRRIRIGRSRSR